MFKQRALLLLTLSVVLGVGAAWVANRWVQQQLTPDAEAATTEPVLMAALKIPYGAAVSPRHVRVVQMPLNTVPENAYRTMEDIEGKVATKDVLSGEILIAERFADHLGGSTLAALIDPSNRAVTLRVNDVVGVAGFLLPGNRVDVLASRMIEKRAQTETILRNIKVLAVDQQANTGDNEPVIVRAVTLEVTPSQSEELIKAREEGTIQLALRNPLAEDPLPPVVVAKKKPAPKKSAAPVRRAAPRGGTVTVIRGMQVDTKKVKG